MFQVSENKIKISIQSGGTRFAELLDKAENRLL